MFLFERLPRDVVLLILDYFNPVFYNELDAHKNLLSIARVNRYCWNLLSKKDLYEQWWRKYIASTLPTEEQINVHIDFLRSRYRLREQLYNEKDRSHFHHTPIPMRFYYFYTLKRFDGYGYFFNLKECIAKQYDRAFEHLFDARDFTKQADDEYYMERRHEMEREGIDYDDYRRRCGRRIDNLFLNAIEVTGKIF